MIWIQAWQVDFLPGKLNLGLLVQMDKLKGILKLYTAVEENVSPSPSDNSLTTPASEGISSYIFYVVKKANEKYQWVKDFSKWLQVTWRRLDLTSHDQCVTLTIESYINFLKFLGKKTAL